MILLNLVIFILVSFGLTQILLYGKIFEKIRPQSGKLGQLFHCSLCLSFWTGILIWFLNSYFPWSSGLFNFSRNILTGFFLGCISSGCCYILDRLFSDDGLTVRIHKK